MVRQTLSNRATLLNREASWLKFNWRVLEEAGDLRNPLLERVKFLAISASNLDEFFEVRVGGLLQQLEDGHNSTTPDGLTMVEERELIKDATHEFVEEQYSCWNERLRPELAEQGIRVLGIDELDETGLAFVDDYCERESIRCSPRSRWTRRIHFLELSTRRSVWRCCCGGAVAHRSPIPEL